MASLCPDCNAIGLSREDFTEPYSRHRDVGIIRAGTVAALTQSALNCALCRLLLHIIKHHYDDDEDFLKDKEWDARWFSMNRFGYRSKFVSDNIGSAIVPGVRISQHGVACCNNRVQLIDDVGTTKPLRGRLLRPTTDVDMIRHWLAKCDKEHGPNCQRSNLLPPARRSNLLCIAVQEKCLTTIDSNSDYIALSYVWGLQNEPQTRIKNFEQFSKPGAFASANLPQTILDSIAVTEALGYCYLWVDSLCIIQDLDEEKMELIGKMDAIYGNASLTLVAASGENVQHGLSGWDVFQGQRRNLKVETIGLGLRVGVLPNLERDLGETFHANRGWTYQETYLSPRCLIFFNGFVSFHCGISVWREDLVAETDGLASLSNALFGGSLDAKMRFCDVVEQYSSRQLSYESDYQFAFAGIQSALAASMGNTRIWFGIPASAFDWAILWQNAEVTMGDPLTRRIDSPSWSWMGHKGQVMMKRSSGFDQNWLRQKTWIDWHIVDAEHLVPVWDPERDNTEIWPDIDAVSTSKITQGWSHGNWPRRQQGQKLKHTFDSDDDGDDISGRDDPNSAIEWPHSHSDSASDTSPSSHTAYVHRRHHQHVESSNFRDSSYSKNPNHSVRQLQQSSSEFDSNESDSPASLTDSSDEEFPFLQYGIPKPDNIYGREEDCQTAALLDQFRVAREVSSLGRTFSSLSLYFSTILCSYYVERVTDPDNDSGFMRDETVLKDKHNIGCGLVHPDAPIALSASGPLHTVDVLVVSWAPEEVYNLNSGVYEGNNLVSSRFNVLLVKKYGNTPRYERIGTGELSTKALVASLRPAQWTDIIMV